MSATAACVCGTCASCSGAAARPAVADPLTYAHGAIKARMLARIAGVEMDGVRPLDRLSTRDPADPAIALIDAFAGSLHILAYSAARLSDDSSILRTTDRDALAYLTRMLGYEPRPALSASTTLAFTVSDLPEGPTRATVPAGTKVASVPGQDEKPQTFETDAELDARAEWNALRPVVPKIAPAVTAATDSITVEGTATTAKVGDPVLVYLEPQTAGASWLFARVASIVRDPDVDHPGTVIGLASQAVLPAIAALKGTAFRNCVIILAQRAAAFGSTAPNMALLPPEVKTAEVYDTNTKDWTGLQMGTGGSPAPANTVDLDAIYPDAMQGRFVIFSAPAITQLGSITRVVERSRSGFGLSAKLSEITVDGGVDVAGQFLTKVRETAIFIETDREILLTPDADVEMPAAAAADRLTVAGEVALPVGRKVILTGEKWGAPAGTKVAEVATVKSATIVGGATLLQFERPLAGRFHSLSLVIFGNSVGASHGETMPNAGVELVGSGDAARHAPRYRLKGSPLSHGPAANSRGYAPAVAVRVSDRLYEERPVLYGLGEDAPVYTVRTVEEEKSELQFAGRLPTGINNITAAYRVGSGLAGNVEAGRLTTVMTPVLGITEVVNPVAADGGSDAETLEDMRASAPQSIRTLDRVVSLSDFEVFARRFRGIGKALATELHVGMRSVVLLTIATTELQSPVPGSSTIEDLRTALAPVSAPRRFVRIEGFTPLAARVTIALASDPAFRRGDVEAAVRTVLATAFSRETRGFGEALHESAILAEAHKVGGVIAAGIASFSLAGGPAAVDGRLLSPAPTLAGGVFVPAGLLSLAEADILFAEMLP
ncbi:MAG TPA: baseplate J/gp47 family protein [Allosphingosinicella sp.]|jgi:hypothetical protein